MLPPWITLFSGPGCPVCVTVRKDIDRCIKLARTPGVIVATFGDMMRAPGQGFRNYTVLSIHKRMMPVLESLMLDETVCVDGFVL